MTAESRRAVPAIRLRSRSSVIATLSAAGEQTISAATVTSDGVIAKTLDAQPAANATNAAPTSRTGRLICPNVRERREQTEEDTDRARERDVAAPPRRRTRHATARDRGSLRW